MKLTIPSIEDLEGIKKLSVFEDNIIEAQATDFAKALGVGTLIGKDFYSGYSLKDYNSNNKLVTCIYKDNLRLSFSPNCRFMGIRLMVNFSDISKYCSNIKVNRNGHIYRATCFMYPKNIANISTRTLDALYKMYRIDPKNPYLNMANSITIDSFPIDYDNPFSPKLVEQYIYNKKIYTCISSNAPGKITLSDNNTYDKRELIWFESSPIVWDIDQNKNIAITHDIITGGIPFDEKKKYKGKFERTTMNYYLNNYLNNDLIDSIPYSKNNYQYKKTR